MSDNPWIEAARRGPAPAPETETGAGDDAEPTTTPKPLPDGPAAPPATSTGIARPQAGVPQPGQGALQVRMVRPTATLWVVGAHGGAGESSIAKLSTTWAASEHAWPTPGDVDHAACPCVLVARTHASGLLAAQAALAQWASGALGSGTTLLGLILIADAPKRLPRPLRDLADHVVGGAPRVWRVDWIQAWRLGEQLDPETRPRHLDTLLTDLTALSGSPETE